MAVAKVEVDVTLAYIIANEKTKHKYRMNSFFNVMTLPIYNIRLYKSKITTYQYYFLIKFLVYRFSLDLM